MFFTAIHQMMTEGVDLTLVIRKANGQLAVSTLPKSNGLKDEAQNHIVPLTVNGKPEELDAGFLQTVARPIQKAVGLITNMAQFEVQAEKAASESKAAKDAKAKETKEEKERREKYEKHLKKAEELIAAKKSVDEIRDYIGADSLMNKGSLFELMDEPVPQAQSQPRPQPMAATAQQRQQPQPQPMAVSVQQPPYPPQPQVPGSMAGQPQQPSMWPPQQPPHRPVQHQTPPQPQYAQQPSVQPQNYGGQEVTHWQEPEFTPEDYRMQYPAAEEINYNPKDYEEYPDFPQSMLEPKYSPYQTV